MARLKKVYTDEKYELDRKRDRVRKAMDWIFAAVCLAGVAVMGYYQEHGVVVGIGAILEAAVMLLYLGFRVYTYVNGWEIMTVYDEPELRKDRHRMWRDYQEEKKNTRISMTITDVLLAVTGIVSFIAGILRLCGLI